MELTDDELVRFMAKVDKDQHKRCNDHGCWMWTAGTTNGAGMFWLMGGYEVAHRLSYENYIGPIPDDMIVKHTCPSTDKDNRRCVNPDHLILISRREWATTQNNKRRSTHCPQGHEYTEENTYWRKQGRRCKQCHLAYNKNYKRKKPST